MPANITETDFYRDPGVKRAVADGRCPPQGKPTKSGKRSKYRNVPVVIDGHRFPSQSEAERYGELKLMLMAGVIEELRLQVSYDLGNGGKYVADFVYLENGETVVEDRKGYRTREYKRKRKLMREIHGITIRET